MERKTTKVGAGAAIAFGIGLLVVVTERACEATNTLERIESTLERVESALERVNDVEPTVEQIRFGVSRVESRVERIEGTVDRIESAVDAERRIRELNEVLDQRLRREVPQ